MKKILALFMALIMLVGVLTACDGAVIILGNESGDNNYTENHQTGNPTENPMEKPMESYTGQRPNWNTDEYAEESFTSVVPVEDLDFEGESIKIIVRNSRNVQREWYKDVPEDDLDEVIALRNEVIADELNIEVKYELVASSLYDDCLSEFTRLIIDDIDSDFHYYDVAANYAYAGASAAVRDYIANLADKELFPYFEFSLPCWNQSIVRNTMADDQLYYITGALNLSTFDKSIVVFLNKTMYNEKRASSDPADLQDVAIAGDWDYDMLYRWSSVFDEINNEDGAQHDDFYGISSAFSSIPLDAFPAAWDLEFIKKEADGSHAYDIVGNSKIEEAIIKAQNLLDGTKAVGVNNADNTDECYLGGYLEPITHFANDKSVFAIHLLYATEDDNITLREMSSDWGILPIPKYDADEQENYGTTAHDSYTLMTVLDHSNSSWPTKGEAISAYLQYSYEQSYEHVRGYYINRIIKPKYFGTDDTTPSLEKSTKILNEIMDNVEFSFASVYAPQLDGVLSQCWRNVVLGYEDKTTAEDAFASQEDMYVSDLEAVDTWLGLK